MAELMVVSQVGFKGRGIACLLQVMYVCNKRIRILSLLLLLFINFAAQAAEPKEAKKDKKVAVVLSGGGAKGMAHIGVLKVIEEVGIPVDMVVGTSIGSLVGGLYAVGYNAQMLDSIVRGLDWSYLLSDRPNRMELNIEDREKQNIYIFSKPYFFGEDNHSRAGFIQGINVEHLFDNLTGDYPDSISFNELPREFACVATNLIDNSEYVFHSGVLAQAMRSSMSIPGVFAPVFKDSMVLVDGGLKNNYPVDIAREMGADYVIGVVLQGDSKKQQDLKSTASILGQLVDINVKNKYEENVANTDIYIHVDCSGYGSLSFNKEAVNTLLQRGENTARQKLDAFIALKKEIDETDASVKVVPTPSPNKVELERQESNVLNVYAGGRFDIEEMAAIQGNVTYTMLPKKFPIDIEATLRLGRRVMGRFDAAVNFKKWGKMNIAYIFRHNDINIYYAGHRDQNTIFNSHCIDLSLFTFNVKNLQISFNAKWNYTNFVYTLANTNNLSSLIDDNNLHHFVYNVKFHYNSEDAPFFITRGTRFTANVGYYSDDGARWQGEKGIFVADAMWRTTFPCGKYVGIRPMLYGRVIFGDEPHTIFSNYVGGTTFSRYFEQQMPFAGVGHVEPVRNAFIGAQLNTYVRIKTKHYIFLDFATAKHASNLTRMFDHNALSGSMLSYYYRTFLGPIGASFLYNNRSDKYYFYFTFGYEF